MRLPRLDLVTAALDSDKRDMFKYVFVDPKNGKVVATNTFALVIHELKGLFSYVEFSKPCFIHRNDWRELTKEFDSIKLEDDRLVLKRDGKKVIIPIRTDLGYVDYLNQIPKGDPGCSGQYPIKINPVLLSELSQAMTTEDVGFQVNPYKNFVTLTAAENDIENYSTNCIALLMHNKF